MADRPKAGYDVGAGKVREGDIAVFDGKSCLVLTVFHDGDVEIATEIMTVKWRQVVPAAGERNSMVLGDG